MVSTHDDTHIAGCALCPGRDRLGDLITGLVLIRCLTDSGADGLVLIERRHLCAPAEGITSRGQCRSSSGAPRQPAAAAAAGRRSPPDPRQRRPGRCRRRLRQHALGPDHRHRHGRGDRARRHGAHLPVVAHPAGSLGERLARKNLARVPHARAGSRTYLYDYGEATPGPDPNRRAPRW
jgi:hypothetical protein